MVSNALKHKINCLCFGNFKWDWGLSIRSYSIWRKKISNLWSCDCYKTKIQGGERVSLFTPLSKEPHLKNLLRETFGREKRGRNSAFWVLHSKFILQPWLGSWKDHVRLLDGIHRNARKSKNITKDNFKRKT